MLHREAFKCLGDKGVDEGASKEKTIVDPTPSMNAIESKIADLIHESQIERGGSRIDGERVYTVDKEMVEAQVDKMVRQLIRRLAFKL